jgi:hypothetical protein
MTEQKYSSDEYTRKISYVVREIDREQATDLVQDNHYSPVMPQLTKHWLGIFREGSLVGVTTLGWGTQPKHTIQKVVSKDVDSKDYYEIGKMCLLESEMKNSETQMISQVVEWIRSYNVAKNKDAIQRNKEIRKSNWQNKEVPGYTPLAETPVSEIKFLYTLADGIMGKCGYVYQAANFYYGGEYWTDSYMSSKGEKVHPRTTNQLCMEEWVWRYNEKSPGFDKDFKEAYDKKLEDRKSAYELYLAAALQSVVKTGDRSLIASYHRFCADFYDSVNRFNQDYEDFESSGKPFGERPRQEDYLPKVPNGMSGFISNPKKDYLKKQQVFWLSPKFMKKVGLRKIGGKMFRYIYPLTRGAKKLLQASDVDWKIGSGVYPKEEDLKWKELVSKGKTEPLDGMPPWNLQIVEHNKKNVNAHKKSSSARIIRKAV